MADEQVVDQNQDTTTNDSGQKPEVKNDSQKPDTTSTQRPDADKTSGWEREKQGILADLKKEREARQSFEQKIKDAEGRYESERRRVQALAGLTPDSPEEAELKQVRARLSKVLPGIDRLTDPQVLEKLLALGDRAESLEEAANHHWTQHGQQMLESVVKGVSDQLGGALSDRQAARVKQAYAQAAEADPEFLARHSRSDPSLVKEFVQSWIEDWFEPARRKVTQTEVDRQRRVPGGRDRSVASSGGKKVDLSDPKAFEQALVDSFKGHGGAFGE